MANWEGQGDFYEARLCCRTATASASFIPRMPSPRNACRQPHAARAQADREATRKLTVAKYEGPGEEVDCV